MSTRKVTRYVDAQEEYYTRLAQRTAYPELKDNPLHTRQLMEAKAAWLVLMRGLTGGELAAARREAVRRKLTHEENANA
jgi:hypothetical protein